MPARGVNPLAPITKGITDESRVAGHSMTLKAPRLNDPKWIIFDWPQACVIKRSEIVGVVRFVYNPPPARRWVR